MNFRIIASCVLALALTACNATSNTSFRQKSFPDKGASTVLIDAKQRAILTQVWDETRVVTEKVDKKNGDTVTTTTTIADPAKIHRFCSEPSPDFVSVMAQSLSAGGSFGQSADPASLEIMAQFAYSRGENGTTIARTQTINMLRELMFRTCERFLSGGYDEMELSIQAVRDQRLMVSILAIEQLTGAVAPNPVVISAAGSGSAGLGEAAVKTFDKLRDQKKKAETDQSAAQKARDAEWVAKEGEAKSSCAANKEAYDKEDDKSKLGKDVKDKKAACDKLEADLKTAKEATKEATEAYDTVKKAMDSGGVTAATVAEAIAQGGLNRASTAATQEVAGTVKAIVQMNFDDDTEVMLFCLRSLRSYAEKNGIGNLDADLIKPLLGRCLEYLDNDVAAKIAESEAEKAEAEMRAKAASATLNALNEGEANRFRTFWANIQNVQRNGGDAVGYLNSLINRYFDEYGEDIQDRDALGFAGIRGAKTEQEMRLAFVSLNDLYERRLLELMNE